MDDAGLEVLKKAADPTTPGSKADYTLKVKIASPSLPSGAATEATLSSIDIKVCTAANQTSEIALLTAIDNKVSTSAKQDTGNTSLNNIDLDTSSIITLITSSNTKLDTVLSDLVTVEGKQDTGNASLANIDVDTSSIITLNTTLNSIVATSAKQDTGNASASSIDSKLTTTNSNLSTLNSNVSTAAKQDTGNASASSIDSKLTTTNSLITSTNSKLDTSNTALSAIQTSAASIDTKTSNGSQKTQVVDGSGNVQGPVQTLSGTNYMPVVLASSATPGSALVSRSIQVAGSDGTNARTISTDTSGQVNINNVSGTVSLPTNAATSALQTTGNSTLASILSSVATSALQVTDNAILTTINSFLSSIDSKLATLGQKVMSGSMPVTIASDQTPLPVKSITGTLANVLDAELDLDVGGFNTCAFEVTGTWSGTIIMEGTYSTFATLTFTGPGLAAGSSAAALSTIMNSTNQTRMFNCAGYKTVRARKSVAGTGTANVTITAAMGPHVSLIFNQNVANLLATVNLRDGASNNLTSTLNNAIRGLDVSAPPLDGNKATYSASASGIVMAATPTDVFTLTGSATKTIRIMEMRIDGSQTTEADRSILLIKRSTANSAGTSSTLTAIPWDSNDVAATAVARSYTANPTLGTTVGTLLSDAFFLGDAAKPSAEDKFIWQANGPAKAIVLRGTGEVLAVNFNSVTSAGSSVNFYVKWTEE